MKRVLVLGATGLIGHQITLHLKSLSGYEVHQIAHKRKLCEHTIQLNARHEQTFAVKIREIHPEVIINCIGILITEATANPEHAIFLNAYLPHQLRSIADEIQAKLIHISTDCVFSGKKGQYVESDIKDAFDIYGKTKGLGEVTESPHLTLRTSVIGPEIKDGEELFHWFMRQSNTTRGFTKSIWSGVTTLELAKAVEWAIKENITGLYHITNGVPINKFDLLTLIKKHTSKDIEIEIADGRMTDKSFVDTRKERDYEIPNYDIMIKELVEFMKENSELYSSFYSLGSS
jgi:dTDP-4-dehydrorhamnose reductase